MAALNEASPGHSSSYALSSNDEYIRHEREFVSSLQAEYYASSVPHFREKQASHVVRAPGESGALLLHGEVKDETSAEALLRLCVRTGLERFTSSGERVSLLLRRATDDPVAATDRFFDELKQMA